MIKIASWRPLPFTRTGMRRLLAVWMALLAGTTITLSGSMAQAPMALPNRWCPVHTGELAKPEHEFQFGGETVFFCSERCKKEFAADPTRYLANLAVAARSQAEADSPENPTTEPVVRESLFEQIAHGVAHYSRVLALVGVALVMFLIARRIKTVRRRQDPDSLLPKPPVVNLFGKPAHLLIIMQFVMIVHFVFWDEEQPSNRSAVVIRREDESVNHAWRALSYQAPILDQAHAEQKDGVPPRLEATYQLRSAPEKSNAADKPVAGATVRVDLRDESGQPARHGSPMAGRRLYLHVEIKSDGSPGVLPEEQLQQLILMRLGIVAGDDEPVRVGSEIRLNRPTGTTPWQARYPIGDIPESVEESARLTGVIYLCEPNAHQGGLQTLESARFAVSYALATREGKLEPTSRLWLTALESGKPYRLDPQPKTGEKTKAPEAFPQK